RFVLSSIRRVARPTEAGDTPHAVAKNTMAIIFACEKCGRAFQVDDDSRGKRGRCLHCGHIMRIPSSATDAAAPGAHLPQPIEPPAAPKAAPFRLSPPEPRPMVRRELPAGAPSPEPAEHHPAGVHKQPHLDQHQLRFELLDEDSDSDSIPPVSPEIARGLRE